MILSPLQVGHEPKSLHEYGLGRKFNYHIIVDSVSNEEIVSFDNDVDKFFCLGSGRVEWSFPSQTSGKS